jgi:site-specific DNA-adenine methylase
MPLPYHAGKAFLAKTISTIIHKKIEENPSIKNYAEPFSGMQRVGIQVMVDDKHKVFKKYYFSDVIPRISVFFKALHKGWLPNTRAVTQKKWESYKKNNKPSAQKTFIGYTLGFAGQYFGGSKPAANKPPHAKTEEWTSIVLKRKKEYIKSLQPYFKSSKYVYKEKSVFDMDYKNTIIYCDPPYVATAFRAKKIWDKEKEKKLWNTIKKWLHPSKNNIVILSNSKRTAKVKGLRIKKIYEDDVDYGSWKENYVKRKEMIFEVVNSSKKKKRKKRTRKKRGGAYIDDQGYLVKYEKHELFDDQGHSLNIQEYKISIDGKEEWMTWSDYLLKKKEINERDMKNKESQPLTTTMMNTIDSSDDVDEPMTSIYPIMGKKRVRFKEGGKKKRKTRKNKK